MTTDPQVKDIESLQLQIKSLYDQRRSFQDLPPVTLEYRTQSSYVTRAKAYKESSHKIDCGHLNRVLKIDPIKKIAIVEPRVTIEKLIKATLAVGLTPAVVPELKDITVGGAILGIGAESASHRFGCFNDICNAFEFISAEGKLIRATPAENDALYYGLPGSYGTLGILTSAEIQLIPARKSVHLRYHVFSKPKEAIERLLSLSKQSESPDFLDGIILKNNLAVVIEGCLVHDDLSYLPQFSAEPIFNPYYYQHVHQIALDHPTKIYEERMNLYDYFFRYDPGAFWVGPYLFHMPLLTSLVFQGIMKWLPKKDGLSPSEVKCFSKVPYPNAFSRALMKSFTNCKILCKMLHRAEEWVRNRFVIQDFCIPESNALKFLDTVLQDPAIFPMWLLPIKSTTKPQILAPHKTENGSNNDFFINFGLYGLPAYASPVSNITRKLEQFTQQLGGRKVLYSHSYYTLEEFWKIYPQDAYEALREKTSAKGFWVDLADKVLTK